MLPIPQPILVAGLVGVLVALVVATAQQRWQLRVFVILALRIAIGWHFLFEGLHKVHSRYTGPTDTNKVFTSEFYFAAGEGPFAEKMRREYLGDPVATYTARLTQSKPLTADEFKKLSTEEQAPLCPPGVAALLNGADAEQAKLAQATYAGWVYGSTGRDAKIKFVSGDVKLSGPQWLKHIEMLEKELKGLEERQSAHLGRGEGTELTKTKTARTELLAAKNDLAKETDSFISELRTSIGLEALPAPTKEKLKWADKWTAYGITIIGACILFGVFTPLACLAGAGFLAMTYLSHPTVPWLGLPPMTEGNPLFINKNIIEALGLLVVAAHPTGRWMGFDALWTYFVLPKGEKTAV
jgi:uncharacterized membrane protein YphA (DoxX/SURF4 family)